MQENILSKIIICESHIISRSNFNVKFNVNVNAWLNTVTTVIKHTLFKTKYQEQLSILKFS